MIDADLLEDFYEALGAAIESGINVPGSHAVTDMFREAVARAEAAEAEVAALRAQVDGWRPVTEKWPDNPDGRLYWIYQKLDGQRVGGYRLARFDGDFYDPSDHVYLTDNSVKYAMYLPAIPAPPQEAAQED